MKRLAWIFALLVIAGAAFAMTGSIPVNHNGTDARLTYSNQSGLGIHYSVGNISHDDVVTREGTFARLYIDGYTFTNRTGMPQLPLMRKIIRVPLQASILPRVSYRQTSILNLADYGITSRVLPRQESVSKSQNPDDVPFVINEDFYNGGTWTAEAAIKVEEIGMLRGARLVALDFTPMQYNPATGQIEIITSADVDVVYNGADWEATEAMYQRYY